MSEQAERIRDLLASNEGEQQLQGYELLTAVGDGALYAAVLDGWEWDDRAGSLGRPTGERDPYSRDFATHIWMEAPLDAPFPPRLALRAVRSIGLHSLEQRHLTGKLAALPRLREAGLSLYTHGLDPDVPLLSLPALPPGVRRLDLGGFRLSLPEDRARLAALPRLESLRLRQCRLSPEGVGPIPRLERLRLESCEGTLDLGSRGAALRRLTIQDMPSGESLAPLQGLRALRLNKVQGELPPGLGALRRLSVLNLDDNGLKSLPPQIRDLPRLRWLSLDKNALAGLPPDLSLPRLRQLSLAQNALESLPSLDLPRLRRLSLDRNRLTSVPPAVTRLSGLRQLDLRQNEIGSLPPGIAQLKQLRSLSLGGNPLADLPPAMAGLRELRHLLLSYTALRQLPPWLPALERLETLDVLGCPLEDLDVDLLLALPRLRLLSAGNRLREPALRLSERAREQGRSIDARIYNWGD